MNTKRYENSWLVFLQISFKIGGALLNSAGWEFSPCSASVHTLTAVLQTPTWLAGYNRTPCPALRGRAVSARLKTLACELRSNGADDCVCLSVSGGM